MGKVRLLVVDDRAPARAGLQALLATCPEVEVIGEAADGQEALQLAQAHQPDVIIMDIQMPVMSGLEATRRLKASSPNPAIIILTMYPDQRNNALAAGADAFLVKGCTTQVLLDTISSLDQAPPDGVGSKYTNKPLPATYRSRPGRLSSPDWRLRPGQA